MATAVCVEAAYGVMDTGMECLVKLPTRKRQLMDSPSKPAAEMLIASAVSTRCGSTD